MMIQTNWLSVLPDDILTIIYRKSLNDEIKNYYNKTLIGRYKNHLKQLQNRNCEKMAFHAVQYLHQSQAESVSSNEILYMLLRLNQWWQYKNTYESRALFYISLAISLSECPHHKNIRILKLLKQALGNESNWFSQDLNKRLCGSETYIGAGFQQVQDVCNCV